MDANVALEKIRDALRDAKYRDAAAVNSDPALKIRRSSHIEYEPMLEIIEHFEALDEWLSRGGFLPADWNKGR